MPLSIGKTYAESNYWKLVNMNFQNTYSSEECCTILLLYMSHKPAEELQFDKWILIICLICNTNRVNIEIQQDDSVYRT